MLNRVFRSIKIETLFEVYPHEKTLGRHFPLAVKLAKGHSFPFAPYLLGTLTSYLDHFTLDLQCSWGRFQVKTFVLMAFLQIWLWSTLGTMLLSLKF